MPDLPDGECRRRRALVQCAPKADRRHYQEDSSGKPQGATTIGLGGRGGADCVAVDRVKRGQGIVAALPAILRPFFETPHDQCR
jgi:hypothetical protein